MSQVGKAEKLCVQNLGIKKQIINTAIKPFQSHLRISNRKLVTKRTLAPKPSQNQPPI